MNKELKRLVDTYYNKEQKDETLRIVNSDMSRHFTQYMVLVQAFDEVHELDSSKVAEMFKVREDELTMLSEVDYIIATIINTLSIELNENIKQGYDNALVLDNSQPELLYLIGKTEEYLNS